MVEHLLWEQGAVSSNLAAPTIFKYYSHLRAGMINKFIFTPDNFPEEYHDSVALIGNFDGFHLGHVECIKLAKSRAMQRNAPLILIYFTPHPKVFFNPELGNIAIYPENERIAIAKDLGIDCMVNINFTHELAQLSYRYFAENILQNQLRISQIFVGQDFRFGKNRMGNPNNLANFIATTIIPMQRDDDMEIHSTAIRNFYQDGDIPKVRELLGRDPVWRGIVIQGDKLARTLNMPTANINLGAVIRPKYGVYAVKCQVIGDENIYNGVANLGITPSFENKREKCETHFINFNQDIYGQEIRIFIKYYLRGELKFSNMQDLINQMQLDKAQALLRL